MYNKVVMVQGQEGAASVSVGEQIAKHNENWVVPEGFLEHDLCMPK